MNFQIMKKQKLMYLFKLCIFNSEVLKEKLLLVHLLKKFKLTSKDK